MVISSFLDPRWKSLNIMQGHERELVNTTAIKHQWNGETYLQQLLQDTNKSSIPISQPSKIPKLNQDLGNL